MPSTHFRPVSVPSTHKARPDTDTRRRLATVAVPLALVVAVDPGGLAPFGPAKWLGLTVLVPTVLSTTRTFRIHRPVLVLWGAFLAVVVVAAAFGLDRHLYAWVGTPERHFGALTWLLCAIGFVLGANVNRRALLVGASIAIAVTGVWAALEVAGIHPIALSGAGDRAVGPLGSSAYLGAAAALLTPVAVGSGAWLAAALGTVALIASGARAAWVGVLVVVALAAAARRRIVPLLAVLAIAVGAAFAFGVASRVPDLVTDRNGGMHGRLDEWRVASRVVRARPLLGAGPEGYRIAVGPKIDADYERVHGRDPLPDRAHDAILDVAATTGIPGALLYVALLAFVARAAVRALRRGDRVAAGIGAGLLAYWLQSMFLFPLAELDPIAWLLAGVLLADDARTTLDVPRVARATAALVASVALIAGALDLTADRRAKATLVALADQRLPHGTGARDLRPDQLRYQLGAARAAAGRGTPTGYRTALGAVGRALDLSPADPVATAERGRLLVLLADATADPNDVQRAVAYLERLVRHDPNNRETRARLAVARRLRDGTERGG